MIFLKIFHKNVLLILILLVAGCSTNSNRKNSVENIAERVTVGVIQDIAEQPVESDKPKSEINIDENVEFLNLDWTLPDFEKLALSVLLPEVSVPDKIERNEFLNYYSVYDQYYLERENFYNIESIKKNEEEIDLLIETDPEITEIKVISVDDDPVGSVEIIKTIFTDRDMTSVIGNKLSISLDGRGWIYLPNQENSEIEYNGRQITNENTIYTFIPKAEGLYLLRFQFQNLTENNYTIEKINLKITRENPVDDTDDLVIEPELEVVETASLIDFESSIIMMVSEGDSEGLSDNVAELLESTDPSIMKILPKVAELLYNASYYAPASYVLENLIRDMAPVSSNDYYYFLLGKIYEKDSIIRNEQISAKYYKTLIDSYPASLYWEESRDRYRFLKRRYIDIR